MFTQAKQNRVFEDIISQIQEAILNGGLKAGERLPPERELKEIFRTSRGTLREALRVLEQKGLIEIKTGVSGGAFIRAVSSHQISESFDLLLRSQKVSLNDLAEFRAGVEGIVTGHAAEIAGKEDIKVLNDIINLAKINIEEDNPSWDKFIDIDNKFHMELARIAGNHLYILVLKSIHNNINRYYNSYLSRGKKIVNESYQDICEIVKAVEEGNATKSRFLAQEHVRRFNRFMELAEKENKREQDESDF